MTSSDTHTHEWNRSREMYSPMRRNRRKQQYTSTFDTKRNNSTRALSTQKETTVHEHFRHKKKQQYTSTFGTKTVFFGCKKIDNKNEEGSKEEDRRIGEYISLGLFYFVSLTSSCSLSPRIAQFWQSLVRVRRGRRGVRVSLPPVQRKHGHVLTGLKEPRL